MASPFEFYFDFSSPYGYFASTQIDALASGFDRGVRWKPILLGPMFKKMGSAALVDMPLKGAYSYHDFARTAALFGIPYRQPDRFPISTVNAARAMVWIEQNAGEPKAREFAKAVYRAYFAEQYDIGELDVIVGLAHDAGIDAALLPGAMQQDAIKTALKERVDAAMDKGVFGSPFILIDGEPFWGFDRFDYIRKWLSK